MIRQANFIRLANYSDLEQITKIIKTVCQEMHLQGNDQWDDNYPVTADFANDIQKKELYVSEINGLVSGFICINYSQPEEYAKISWSSNQKPMILHRMAVAPDFRGGGIGSILLQFAEGIAQDSGVNYLRSDTNSLNDKMNALFRKLGYVFVGEMPAFGKKSPFNFYDKVLVHSEN